MTIGGVPIASAGDGQEGDDQVDQPEGFNAEVVAPHAAFPDGVAAGFSVVFDEGEEESVVVRDASNVVVARVTVEPGGTSGWHTHPGPVIVSVVEGDVDITFSGDCVARSYTAGEAFVDTGGHAEIATNPSESERAMVYAIFLGVADDQPPTTWVEPQDC